MSAVITASAPGKVVLCGEYVVLDGAPAISAAVDRRARATVRAISGAASRLAVRGPVDTEVHFEHNHDGVHWRSADARFDVIDSVWRTADVSSGESHDVLLDTSQFFDAATHRKTGIGSSAALVVALCAAAKGSTDIAEVAQRAHRDLQGGSGSGVDIATSVAGGLIEYRMQGSATRSLRWPRRLSFRLLWSGVASSTTQKLAKLNASVARPSRLRLVGAAEAMANVWRNESASEILDQYRDYTEHLHAFSVDHGLGIFDAGHYELWQDAIQAGLVYKPCGAGGGDIGIVMGQDADALDAFVVGPAAEFSVLDCALGDVGVRIEP